MPLFDRKCDKCGDTKEDCLERSVDNQGIPHEGCGGQFHRVWLPGSSNAVISDEIDITVPAAVATERDGSPKRYRSREAWKKDIEARGWTNLVEHKGGKGSDKSKHTKRWF